MLYIKKRLVIIGAALAALTAGYAAPAAAQATRTWVSGVGDDVNPCSRTAPCKTFAGAISKTSAGGEIDCLDPAGYGSVTITKSIMIDCEAMSGSVLASSADGIIVNDANGATPGTAIVVLRGLHFEGLGASPSSPGLAAINYVSGASLTVEKSTIRNFTGNAGILFAPQTTSQLSVTDTSVINSGSATGAGIVIKPFIANPPIISVVLDNVKILKSPNIGLQVSSATSFANGFRTIVLVKNSEIFGGAYGATAIVPSNTRPIQLTISDSSISSNTGYGVAINGAGAQGRISNTVITGNATGVSAQNGGAVLSHGGNRVYANGTDGTFTATFQQQ